MCIRLCVQDECVDLCSPRVFENIGGLRGCKSLASNRRGMIEPSSTHAKNKFEFLVNECNLVEKTNEK